MRSGHLDVYLCGESETEARGRARSVAAATGLRIREERLYFSLPESKSYPELVARRRHEALAVGLALHLTPFPLEPVRN